MLHEFAFDDCLLLEITVPGDFSSATIVVEAWLPLTAGQITRVKGQLQVQLSRTVSLHLDVRPGYHEDKALPVDRRGDEVYEFASTQPELGVVDAILRTDYLYLRGRFEGIGLKVL